MNPLKSESSEKLPPEVYSLAAQLYAQHSGLDLPPQPRDIDAQAKIPPEFIQQAIATLESQPQPTVQLARPQNHQRLLLSLAAVLTLGAILTGTGIFLIAKTLESQVVTLRPIEPNQPAKNLGGVNWQGRDLRQLNLQNADLGGANLNDANLSSVDLSNANLGGANLSYANLSGVDLSNADLRGANLANANLSNANLSNADFEGANLSHAKLSGAILNGTILEGANLTGAIMPNSTNP